MAEPDYFTDADELTAPEGDLASVIRSLVRADLEGSNPGAVLRSHEAARAEDRDRFARAWNEAMSDEDLVAFIEGSAERREKAAAIAVAIAPPDPSPSHNAAARELIRTFDAWERYAHAAIVVPGYTPLDTATAQPGVHPVARRRLEMAIGYFAQGAAPFIVVSGANVYPAGTAYYEALEMKAELLQMGMDEDRIVVEARARHSTTNLRNAGRIMLEHGMRSVLIATVGGGVMGSDLFGQDFYLANPGMSTFYARCERELGYRVGDLNEKGEGQIEFVPSPEVRRINYKDALDP